MRIHRELLATERNPSLLQTLTSNTIVGKAIKSMVISAQYSVVLYNMICTLKEMSQQQRYTVYNIIYPSTRTQKPLLTYSSCVDR